MDCANHGVRKSGNVYYCKFGIYAFSFVWQASKFAHQNIISRRCSRAYRSRRDRTLCSILADYSPHLSPSMLWAHLFRFWDCTHVRKFLWNWQFKKTNFLSFSSPDICWSQRSYHRVLCISSIWGGRNCQRSLCSRPHGWRPVCFEVWPCKRAHILQRGRCDLHLRLAVRDSSFGILCCHLLLRVSYIYIFV